ncbi:MAG: ABC transporter substrate-binding protein [Rhodoferax sp.]|nr:ABC transporter substrate-binding protein [Rhodoferax sp.]
MLAETSPGSLQKPATLQSPALANAVNNQMPKVSEKTRVVFLNPATRSDFWWNTCTSFMQAAANDLGVELKVYYADRSAALMLQQADEALAGAVKPHFIVMQNLKKTAPQIIERAEKSNVKALLFNSGLDDEESRVYGAPREKFANWIGQILPDDAGAGYNLAKIIVNAAKEKKLSDTDGKVEMLALGGTISDSSAIERNKGLTRFLQEHKADVVLNRGQSLPGNWESAKAASVFEAAYHDFPKTAVVWNANDNMAMGVLGKAKEKYSKSPGKDLIVGGIDWNPENLQAVRQGEITATLGGHFMEGAWVIVLLNDYAKGVDFQTEGVSLKSELGAISKANIDKFERALGDRSFEKIDKIDFSKFSKASNPALKAYKFNLDAILSQLK